MADIRTILHILRVTVEAYGVGLLNSDDIDTTRTDANTLPFYCFPECYHRHAWSFGEDDEFGVSVDIRTLPSQVLEFPEVSAVRDSSFVALLWCEFSNILLSLQCRARHSILRQTLYLTSNRSESADRQKATADINVTIRRCFNL